MCSCPMPIYYLMVNIPIVSALVGRCMPVVCYMCIAGYNTAASPSFPTLVVNFPNLFEFESWIFSEQYPLLCIRSFALTKKLYHICSFTACCSAVSMRWFKGWETIYYCKSINRIHICSTMFHYFPIVDPSFDYFDCRSNCLVKSTRLFVDIPRKGPVRLKLVQTARYPP